MFAFPVPFKEISFLYERRRLLNAFGIQQSPAAFPFERKKEENMLNTLLSVIRAILVELVDQLLRKVCTLG